jgi:hypothetical protein
MGAEIIYKGIRICNLCLALLFLDTWARLSEISALPFANVHVARQRRPGTRPALQTCDPGAPAAQHRSLAASRSARTSFS